MKFNWRYIKSFFLEEVVEEGNSAISPGLQVHYAYGKLMLNTANVNYSFGRLDTVFRRAFEQLRIGTRGLQKVLLLGLGAGNVPQILTEIDPAIHVTAVEIDPEVIRLGEMHFGLRKSDRLEVVLADALEFVPACTEKFDMVVVDLFVDDEVPLNACTTSFLRQLAALLQQGGLLLFNRLAHTEHLLQQTEAFGRKMEATLVGARRIQADLNYIWVYENQ